MRLNFSQLITKYNLKIQGIIHIGAHYGQEYVLYKASGIVNIILFEPLPEAFEILKKNADANVRIVNKAVGNYNGKVEMYVERVNEGQSSSILRPMQHLLEYPNIVFEKEKQEVEMIRLDDFPLETKYNMLVLDVQGYELEVLKGAERMLGNVDYIVTEVNSAELYEGCALVTDVDSYLQLLGFKRTETSWTNNHWGDAFYYRD